MLYINGFSVLSGLKGCGSLACVRMGHVQVHIGSLQCIEPLVITSQQDTVCQRSAILKVEVRIANYMVRVSSDYGYAMAFGCNDNAKNMAFRLLWRYSEP